jgi:hypothetical protein
MSAEEPLDDLLDGPFRLLHPLLTAAIPMAVGQLKLPDPIFCIRLYYHDTNAPPEDYCTWVRVLTEPLRQQVLATKRPVDVPFYLWHPQSGNANGSPGRDIGLFEADLRTHQDIMQGYEEIYEMVDSDDGMNRVRELLRQVSRTLNARDWSKVAKVTDDFVVFPADGSGYYGGNYAEDMEESISPQTLELLRQRQLFR